MILGAGDAEAGCDQIAESFLPDVGVRDDYTAAFLSYGVESEVRQRHPTISSIARKITWAATHVLSCCRLRL